MSIGSSSIPLGIDLGTTISVSAYVNSEGRPQTLSGLVPSAISFGSDVIVGDDALAKAADEPDTFCECFKLDMGKAHFSRKIRHSLVPPEVLSGFVLRHLKQRAAEALDCAIHQAVITVPAYFDERRRTATQQAASLAGLEVLDIINEPTAAAVALGYERNFLRDEIGRNRPRRLFVYDLGGGTFDATLLEYNDRTFTTLATDGDVRLGGRDFDEQLVSRIAERFLRKHGVDPRGDRHSLQRLWALAQETKHALSVRDSHTVAFSHLGLRVAMEIPRGEFEDAIEPLVERTLATCGDVVRAANQGWNDLDGILLVGGSSRIPLVSRKLSSMTGIVPTLIANPDEAVAHGAALYAAVRSDQPILDPASRFEVVNVNSHSLGIVGTERKTQTPINKIIIPRNTPLPASRTRQFYTKRDNQPNVRVQLVEGESENPKFCGPVAKCVVHLDPPVPAGTEVEVVCSYDAKATILVTARVPLTRASSRVEIRRDHAPATDSLDSWRIRLTTGTNEKTAEHASHGPATAIDQPFSSPSGLSQIIRRLDTLYGLLGKLHLDRAVPGSALPCQRMLKNAILEHDYLERILHKLEQETLKAGDAFSRQQASGDTAHARVLLSQARALKDHAFIALGRECRNADHIPEGTTHLIEIRQLEGMLD